MSIKVMSLVWDNFNRGGSEKLAMLALADWCNDQGGSLYPSISGVAKKINVSESQARRIMHGFIKEGYLSVIANHMGGNPGQTRHYKLDVERLSTPGVDATPSTSATPSMDARDPLHGCALPLAPMTPEPSLSINKHHISDKPSKSKKSFTEFPDSFSVTQDMFDWATGEGVPDGLVKLETQKFKDYALSKAVKYKDWLAAWRNWMRNAIKYNYKKTA